MNKRNKKIKKNNNKMNNRIKNNKNPNLMLMSIIICWVCHYGI